MIELPEQNHIIEARGLVKKFGFKTVLRKVDLFLKRGDFLALFGPNGAGKTTLIHILCSLMLPTSGTVCVAGYDTRHDREILHQVIGVVSHSTFLYGDLSAFENLQFYGRMFNVDELKRKIEEVLYLVGLHEYTEEHVQTFSRGMQQRLSLARAILHDPLVLFLDEPYTGLDQHGAEDLKQLLQGFKSQGKTIIMTSHNLRKGLELCSQASILKRGTLIYQEEIANIDQEAFETTYLKLTGEKSMQKEMV